MDEKFSFSLGISSYWCQSTTKTQKLTHPTSSNHSNLIKNCSELLKSQKLNQPRRIQKRVFNNKFSLFLVWITLIFLKITFLSPEIPRVRESHQIDRTQESLYQLSSIAIIIGINSTWAKYVVFRQENLIAMSIQN